MGSLPAGKTLSAAAQRQITVLTPSGFSPASDGSITGEAPPAVPGAQYDVLPAVQATGGQAATAVSQILGAPDRQSSHIAALSQLARRPGNAGVELDYTAVNPQQKQAFSDFVASLAAELHKNQHVLVLLRANGINVLISRIRRPLIPLIAYPFHGRKYLDKLPHFPGYDVPALANMAVQRKGLVLGKDVDPTQVRINAVGERDINNAVDSAKGDRRLSSVTGEWVEPLACPSGQQHSQRVFHLASGLMLVTIAIACVGA